MKTKNALLSLAFLLTLGLSACGSTNTDTSTSTETSTSESTLTMSLDELATYDGQNGQPAYVAIDGIIYDVTHAKNWNNGMHENGITAGQDLSGVLGSSPHGTSVLGDLLIIGRLQ